LAPVDRFFRETIMTTTIPQPADDSAGIGPAPDHLSPELAAVWCELSASIAPDAASPSDRCGFELLARLVERMRRGSLGTAETGQLRGLLDQFGLTPDGRRRLEWAKLTPRVSTQ
jgi:hypothetical protein